MRDCHDPSLPVPGRIIAQIFPSVAGQLILPDGFLPEVYRRVRAVGALCIAALPEGQDAKLLFRRLLLWGFSMTIGGALFCQLFIRFFA